MYVNSMRRIVKKLCRFILFRFGLVTFRLHYWKTTKPLICMLPGVGGHDHDPPKPNIIFGDTRVFQIIQEKPETFSNILLSI